MEKQTENKTIDSTATAELIENRIDHLVDVIVNEYNSVFAMDIIMDILDKITPYSFVIVLSSNIYNMMPITLLTLEEVIDISLMAQLSYQTFILFLNLPDICNYGRQNNGISLHQYQLTILWLCAFVVKRTNQLVFKWSSKDISDANKLFLLQMSHYFKSILVHYHRMVSQFQKLDEDIAKRRRQLSHMIQDSDKMFFGQLLIFYLSLFKTGHPPPNDSNKETELVAQYLKSDVIESPYLSYNPSMVSNGAKRKRKKRKQSSCEDTKSNEDIIDARIGMQLFDVYCSVCCQLDRDKDIGVPLE